MTKVKIILIILLITTLVIPFSPPLISAQDEPQLENVFSLYTVQPDDTLISVSFIKNLSPIDIILANNLASPYLIYPNQQLKLPGIPPDPIEEAETPPLTELPPLQSEPHTVQAGDTLYHIANQYNVSVGAIILINDLKTPDILEIGQVLQIPTQPPVPSDLPDPFVTVDLSESMIIQGRTLIAQVKLSEAVQLTGQFEERPLFFSERAPGEFWTIIAIHALTPPNLYPITLQATLADGSEVSTFVNVSVIEGPYGTENIQLDQSRGQLLTDDLIAREREILVGVWSGVSPRPLWDGPFQYPVFGDALQITSHFGTRRSYNDSPATSFHGGTDFGGGIGTPIYAPAPGRVVLADTLNLRGNAVVIDHGMGLFSGYWHQTQIAVVIGQEVQPGDLIGYIGNTGLVTGPHLHWELRLQGIAVEPLQWVQETIP